MACFEITGQANNCLMILVLLDLIVDEILSFCKT